MKLFSVAGLLPALLSTGTLAIPTSISSSSMPSGSGEQADNITGPYYLKTKVINTTDISDKDGLYVWSYHTGAGLSDAVLGSREFANPAYLNNTYQVFNLSDYQWTFFLPSDTNYAGWEPVSITPGYHTSALFLNDTGLQWTAYESFGGWLACDWSHGLPQLFWKVDYDTYNISTCSLVELVTEAIDEEAIDYP